jgi:hypothetical protein
MRFVICVCAILSFGSVAFAQEAQDICLGVLTYTGRDENSQARQNALAENIYSQHCEGSSIKRGSTISIGLEAVVKAIPVKFNFGGASNEEKLNNFCKTYDSRRAEFHEERIDQSTVVREALTSFNDCLRFSTQHVLFNPKIGRTRLVIDVKRTAAEDASITGISYDPSLLTCELLPNGRGHHDCRQGHGQRS